MNRIKEFLFICLLATISTQAESAEASHPVETTTSTGGIYIQPIAPDRLIVEIIPPSMHLENDKFESTMTMLLTLALANKSHHLVSSIKLIVKCDRDHIRLGRWLIRNNFCSSEEERMLFIRVQN